MKTLNFLIAVTMFLVVAGVIIPFEPSESRENNFDECCITFRVEDTTGAPMGGFEVTVLCLPCPNPVICTTDESGECKICNYPAGSYTVTASSMFSALTGQVENINCITAPSAVIPIVVR